MANGEWVHPCDISGPTVDENAAAKAAIVKRKSEFLKSKASVSAQTTLVAVPMEASGSSSRWDDIYSTPPENSLN